MKQRQVVIVMVFRPGHEDPVGIGACTEPRNPKGKDEWRRREIARDRAWEAALKQVMWAEEIPRLVSEHYTLRSTFQRELQERFNWREVVRVVEIPYLKALEEKG